ncbi:MAG: hypothetical protein ACFIN3_00110 [Candidatus Walczuchella monophlebidarum]
MDSVKINQEQITRPFLSKPAWQRLIVMLSGVIFNVLLSIFSCMLFHYGELPIKKMVDTVERNKKHITSPTQLRIFPRLPAIVKNVNHQLKKVDKINLHHVLFIDHVLEILNHKKYDTIRLFINRNGERYEMKIKILRSFIRY